MSTRRFSQRVIDQVDEEGNVIKCRQCGRNVRAPFVFYCSRSCAHAYRMRTSQHYARRVVIEAYGWCCARCRVDCRELEREFLEQEIQRTGNRMAVMMRRKKTFAQAHHKTAVVENGGEAENESAYELLCVQCHRQETADLHARLSQKRRQERLTLILKALAERGQAGLTTRTLMQVLGRAKNLLLEDLRFLRRKGYIERSKQGDYYLIPAGQRVVSRLSGKHDSKKVAPEALASTVT